MTTDDDRTDPAAEPAARPAAAQPQPQPQPPQPQPLDPAVPDEETLTTTATPAVVRRAPRIGAFIRAGVLVGAVLGWVLAVLYSGTTGEGRTGAILITTVAGAGFGALLGAAVASLADRRSTRRKAPSAGRPTGAPPSL